MPPSPHGPRPLARLAPRAEPSPVPLDRLGRVRSAIDDVDARIAGLLGERARLARRAALAKALAGARHKDPTREASVREHYRRVLCRHGWSSAQVDALADAVFDVAGREPALRIAIQGGPGSWSEESLLSLLPDARPVRCYTVADAWRRVREGHAVGAWLARRNTVLGDIADTRGVRDEAEAWSEVTYPVRHALLAPPGLRAEDVERVEAHPLALAQCRGKLDALVPHARRVGAVDGAHAAWGLRATTRTAVLASARLAAQAGLAVLAEDAADDPANATTFALLVPADASP